MTAVLALLASLLWGTSDFLGGTAARRLPTLVVIGASQVVALVGLVPIAALTGELTTGPGYVGWAVAAGLVGLVALGAFYLALATGTMGVVAPIAAVGVVVPVGIGVASGEHPSALQLAGVAVAVLGVVLASGPEVRRRDAVLTATAAGAWVEQPDRDSAPLEAAGGARPLLLAGLAAAGFGLVIFLVARGSRHSTVMTLLGMRVSSVVVLAAVALVRRPGISLARNDLPLLAAVGIGDVSANACFAVASRSGLLSVVAVLSSLYPAVTVLWARQVHGERLQRMQLGGVVAALAGVALIAAGGGTG